MFRSSLKLQIKLSSEVRSNKIVPNKKRKYISRDKANNNSSNKKKVNNDLNKFNNEYNMINFKMTAI